ALPLADGYSTTYRNLDIRSLQPKAMQLNVVGSEKVTVPAGTFDTFKVEITAADGSKTTVWVDKGTRRPVRQSAKLQAMNVATIPPGGVAYAHIHVGFEVMLYILEGRVRHEYGPGLCHRVENSSGDFIFIEPGVPHEVFNMSDTEPVVAVVARSDPSEWQNI